MGEMKRRTLLGLLMSLPFMRKKDTTQKIEPIKLLESPKSRPGSSIYFYGGGPPRFVQMTEADKKRYKE